MGDSDKAQAVLRLDKWLWAARFFKTRAAAAEAVQGGKVQVNGQRAKPARGLRIGDALHIRRGEEVFEVRVAELSDRRGPASVARGLYEESAASLQAREQASAERRLEWVAAPRYGGRPEKHARSLLRRMRGRQD
jgi:ribosome-associated heat shock protein Hsp15